MGAESFRRRKFDRDKLIWNADCGMGNAECEALDPLIAAEWSDEASRVSDGAKSDTPLRSRRSRHYRVIHTGSFGGFETGRTILQNQASLW